jgi:phosphopantetheine adenylyltransferase
MCKTNQQIKHQLTSFENVIYPGLIEALERAASCDINETSSVRGQQVLKEMVASIQAIFQSLITYEKKLVFPAITQLFEKASIATHTPNLADLLQLTKSKEHKIHSLVRTLATVLQTDTLLMHSNCYDKLVEEFDAYFFAAKEKWNTILIHKINNCACFRKTLIQASGIQMSNQSKDGK